MTSRLTIIFWLVFNAAATGWDVALGAAGDLTPYVAGPFGAVSMVLALYWLVALIREDAV